MSTTVTVTRPEDLAAMAFIDKVPANYLNSTTGQGLALAAGTLAAAVASHFGLSGDAVTAAGTIAGAMVLFLFPQRLSQATPAVVAAVAAQQQTQAPTTSAPAPVDITSALAVIKETIAAGEAAKAALAGFTTPVVHN